MMLGQLLKRYGPDEDKVIDKQTRINRALVHYRMVMSDGTPCPLSEPFARLHIGSAGAAYNSDGLRATGITHVVCLVDSVKFCMPDEITYFERISLSDDGTVNALEQFKECYPKCLEFVQSALDESPTNKVLVHCMQGKSRSAAIVVSYLMIHGRMKFGAALDLVRKARPCVCPASPFAQFLQTLENE